MCVSHFLIWELISKWQKSYKSGTKNSHFSLSRDLHSYLANCPNNVLESERIPCGGSLRCCVWSAFCRLQCFLSPSLNWLQATYFAECPSVSWFTVYLGFDLGYASRAGIWHKLWCVLWCVLLCVLWCVFAFPPTARAVTHRPWHTVPIRPLASDANFDPLGKVVSTILFHHKMARVSFITSNYFVRR